MFSVIFSGTLELLTSVKGRVNGVLIINSNYSKPTRFSPDSSCPNDKHGNIQTY